MRDGKVTDFAWEMIAPAGRIVGFGCWVTRGARTGFAGLRVGWPRKYAEFVASVLWFMIWCVAWVSGEVVLRVLWW